MTFCVNRMYIDGMSSIERIWYVDPVSLFRGDRLARFVPETNASLPQQLNAIMRFAIYFSLLMFFVGRRHLALFVMLIVAGATAAVQHAARADHTAAFTPPLGQQQNTTKRTGINSSHIKPCTQPTLDNPFGNVMLSDYTDNPMRPPACNIQDPEVVDKVETLFEHNLYRDVSDAMSRTANSRQFYTNPVTTIPNDQGAFARWCYQTGPTCKEGNGDRCDTNTYRAVPGR